MSQKQNKKRKGQKLQSNDIKESLNPSQVAGSSSQHASNAGFPLQHSVTFPLPRADPVSITLFCIIHDEESPFPVQIQTDVSVGALKKKIKEEKQPMLNGFAADQLQLWKLNDPIPGDEIDDRLPALGTDIKTFAKKMNPTFDISDYFPPQSFLRKHLHIIVEVPEPTEIWSPVRSVSSAKNLKRKASLDLDDLERSSPRKGPRHSGPKSIVTNSPDISSIRASIDNFVYELRPKIEVFLADSRLPPWPPPESMDINTQQFYNDLVIPLVNGRPSLLLHDLGKFPNPNADDLFIGKDRGVERNEKPRPKKAQKRPSDPVETEKHRIFCNTSGSGKTRHLFEGLCQHWGFYFVIAQGTDRMGAPDFESAIDQMGRTNGWKRNIFENNDPQEVNNANADNEDIANIAIEKVLLARWVVFNAFIQTAKDLNGGVLHKDIRRDWLLFQVLPFLYFGGKDSFSMFIDTCLVGVSFEHIIMLRAFLGPEEVLGSSFNPKTDTFFYVVDEAQVAGEKHMGAFADADGKVRRPVLRPIVRRLTKSSGSLVKIIFSGTGFSLSLFKTVLASGTGKDSSLYDPYVETGDFTNQDTQLSYISRYLPRSFLDSNSGTILKSRMYDWLRGRHRFTARYLEELIRGAWKGDQPTSPHKLFNAYVRAHADFTPLDGDSAILENEPDASPVVVDNFQWEKIESEPGLLAELSNSIFTYITQGLYPLWYYERLSLVEYGIARLIGKEVKVEEPLTLIGIVRYFESKGLTMDSTIRARLQDNKGKAFEEIVLLAVTRLLRDGAPLASVFQFHGSIPEWANSIAQVVTRLPSGDFVKFDLADGQPVVPSASVVFCAKDPEDVKNWLESGRTGWCIPGPFMGPDLLIWVRLDNGKEEKKVLLLAIQAKCYFEGNIGTVHASVAAKAIRSVTPQNFFASLIKSNMSQEVEKETREKIDAMLGAINKPGEEFTSGKYNILRVVAAFPLDADPNSKSAEVQHALSEDDHALAFLTRSALTSALATYPYGPSILNMLTASLKRSRGQVD